jgi:Zn-dependent peptidase ImmA (M78 family)
MTPEVEAVLKTLPRKIKVGAYDWRIKVITDPSDFYGEASFEKAVITIWPANHQSPDRVVGTVLHELLHVIYTNEDLEDRAVHSAPEALEEDIVTGFETGLIALYRDNPKLLNWIKRGLKTHDAAAN